MKVGFLGNTNNFPFTLAQAVRELGHDVLFFVDSSQPLHRPEFRYHTVSRAYGDWITDVGHFSPMTYAVPNPRRHRVIRQLRSCDAVISNGLGTSLLPSIRRPSFVLLTGTDLEHLADLESLNRPLTIVRRPAWLWKFIAPPLLKFIYRRIIPAQRSGIQSAAGINYFPRGAVPNGDRLLEDLGIDKRRRVFFMLADLLATPFEPAASNEHPRVFCATRLTWKKPLPAGYVELDDKGSDVMIRGLALFRQQTGQALQIRLVKKGLNVVETMQLAKSEGIDDQITWLEELSQSEVRDEFLAADIVLEQFGTSIVGMAGLDAMAAGRPVIADGRPEIMTALMGEESPICQARTPEEISLQLIRLMNRDERERVGRLSRQYVEQNFSPESAARTCLEFLRTSVNARVSR